MLECPFHPHKVFLVLRIGVVQLMQYSCLFATSDIPVGSSGMQPGYL